MILDYEMHWTTKNWKTKIRKEKHKIIVLDNICVMMVGCLSYVDHWEEVQYLLQFLFSISQKNFPERTWWQNIRTKMTHLILSSSIVRSCLSLRRTSKTLSLSIVWSKLKSILKWLVSDPLSASVVPFSLSSSLCDCFLFVHCLLPLCSLSLPFTEPEQPHSSSF